ncbi:MAG: LysR family transcriptional regulator [Alphaproteobacteria bacterium]|nr:LysR family transcriptional regulator [Alphaproteobacteria bacterium]
MNLPTLRQLQFLDAIARVGSFSRAAQECHVTQPTLSSAIKELEAILGVQLVAREARGATLTRAGEETARRARQVLSEAQDLVAAAHEAGAPLSGEFRLGAIPTIAPYVLPKILPRLHAEFPRLRLFLREDTTDRLLEGLHARRLDAALIALPWEAPGIETETLAEDEFLFIGPSGHPLASRNGLSPDDLQDEEILLLDDGHCLREHALAVCSLPQGQGRGDVSATSLHTLVQMVAGGLGVSLLPRIAADSGLTAGADVAVRAFTEPVIGRAIGIAWRKGSPRQDEARLIGEAVRSALGQNTPG